MRHRIGLLLATCLLASAQTAYAGTGTGKVEIELAGWLGRVYFYTTTHTDVPPCNTYRQRWVFNVGTADGKAMYAYLLSAQLTGQDVRVVGTGVCDVDSTTETVQFVGSIIDYSQHP